MNDDQPIGEGRGPMLEFGPKPVKAEPLAKSILRKALPEAQRADAENAVALLLSFLGQNPSEPGLKDTPARVVRSLVEMTAGYRDDPKEILSRVFEAEDYDEVVISAGIPFASLCEHHMLPFVGSVDVGYLPGSKVVGLSKLARLVDCFARRLQVQERMTKQIADAIVKHLAVRGAAVVVRASHMCMACRGVKKPGSVMVTSRMIGVFRDKPEARAEFLELCRRSGS